MKTYLIRYKMDGQEFGDEIQAEGWNDAWLRLEAIKATGALDGERKAIIPDWLAFLVPVIVFLGNLTGRK